MAAARGIGLSSRFSPQSFLTFVAWRFGGLEGLGGVLSSKERGAHLLVKKCALLITLLAIIGGISIAEFCDS